MTAQSGGRSDGTAHTRSTMDAGALRERGTPDVEGIHAAAEALLSRAANDLRMLTERLRQEYAGAVRARHEALYADAASPEGDDEVGELPRARSLLARLELTVRDLEDSWRFLELGSAGDWSGMGRAFVDQPGFLEWEGSRTAKRILEAQEQERARLAEEIHDGPAQALSNATFQVEIIARMLRRDPAGASAELAAMRAALERELRCMRTFIHGLRPNLDDSGGLASALQDTVERLSAETGISAELDLEAPEDALDLDGRTAVLRVAQEALRNVGKHAEASRVIVSTRTGPSARGAGFAWLLEVRDDGRGFRVDEVLEQSARRHFGLRFMRERAQLVDGDLEIVSSEASGTTVRLRLEPGERSHQG